MNIIEQLWDPSKCYSQIQIQFTQTKYGVGVKNFNLEFQNKVEIKTH
jgi:hypothetical protein